MSTKACARAVIGAFGAGLYVLCWRATGSLLMAAAMVLLAPALRHLWNWASEHA